MNGSEVRVWSRTFWGRGSQAGEALTPSPNPWGSPHFLQSLPSEDASRQSYQLQLQTVSRRIVPGGRACRKKKHCTSCLQPVRYCIGHSRVGSEARLRRGRRNKCIVIVCCDKTVCDGTIVSKGCYRRMHDGITTKTMGERRCCTR